MKSLIICFALAISLGLGASVDAQTTEGNPIVTDDGLTQASKPVDAAFEHSQAQSLAAANSLTTLFAENNGFRGNSFDLTALNECLVVTGWDFNFTNDPGVTGDVSIYWRQGTADGFESTAEGWNLLGTGTVTTAGVDQPTHLDVGGLELPAGEVIGIYYYSDDYPDPRTGYTNGGPTVFANADLELTTYRGIGTPKFGTATIEFRQVNATVYYEPCSPLKKELTSGPDRDGSALYPDFGSVAGLTLNGSATKFGNVLRLTPAALGQAGSAFTTSPVDLGPDASFSTQFSFAISNPCGAADPDGPGADGIAFVVQNGVAGEFALGGSGGGIGYGGLPASLAVEFDSWYNGPALGDPDGNHVGTGLYGAVGSGPAASVGPPRLNDGATFHAWVDYDGVADVLEVRLANSSVRPAAPTLTHAGVDLEAILGGTIGHLGFTSGTGAACGDHDILSWYYGGIDLVVPVGELTPTAYDFTIYYFDPANPLVLINDQVPAEWDVTHVQFDDTADDGTVLPIDCGGDVDFTGDYGMVDLFRGGKPGKRCNSDTGLSWMPPVTTVSRFYWTESSPGSVNRVNADGSDPTVLTSVATPTGAALARVTDVEIDAARNSLYFNNWTVPTPSADEAIYHIDLTSLVQAQFHATSLSSPTGFASGLKRLAIDPSNGDVYFTRGVSYANPIEVSKVDTTGVYTQLYTATLSDGWFPSGIDVDPAGSFVYWGDPTFTGITFDGAINRMTMAGTGPITLLPQLVDGLGRSLAFDPGYGPAGTIFVSAFNFLDPSTGGAIYSFDLASGTFALVLSDPTTGIPDIEIDVMARRIYWTDYVRGEIRSANYDGTDLTTEIGGLTNPYGLALEFNDFSLNVQTLARCHDNRNNQQCRPTSCGALYLNYGAAAYDKVTGELVAGPTEPICLAAVEDVNGDGMFTWDGTGDEDGDGLSDYDEACVLDTDPCVFNTCVGLSDSCIDADGIATAGRGLPDAGDVWAGQLLTAWPTGRYTEGLDWFDNDGSCTWTFGDDLHLEDAAGSCATGIRNGFHEVGADCDVLDLDGSFFEGQQVDVDLETGTTFNGCTAPDPLLKFYDSNGNGFYDDGEDIVLDANANGVFD